MTVNFCIELGLILSILQVEIPDCLRELVSGPPDCATIESEARPAGRAVSDTGLKVRIIALPKRIG